MSKINYQAKGLVFDIRRFSVHDGPGIRTAVFTKGCPLRCLWCHNPEGLDLKRNLVYFSNRCLSCGSCLAVCEPAALSSDENGKIVIDHKLCNQCGRCVEVCPTHALSFDSEYMTVAEVMEKVMQDADFYDEDGGLTITGGDPIFQAGFNLELLKAAKDKGIHTVVESALQVQPAILASFLPYVDLFIADFKVFDPHLHQEYIGVDQELILRNLDELIINWYNPGKIDLLIRMPLIPEHTATKDNITKIGSYISGRSPKAKMELLNFNPLGKDKYERLQMDYLFDVNPQPYSEEKMAEFNGWLKATGVKVVVG